jgi:hypothetical protein
MKNNNTSKLLQNILTLVFLLIVTISFGQRISLKPSGGRPGKLPITMRAGQNTTIDFVNDYNITMLNWSVSNTFSKATTSILTAPNAVFAPQSTVSVYVDIPRSQRKGTFDIVLTYFDTSNNMYRNFIVEIRVR